jgi:hypothetical protein
VTDIAITTPDVEDLFLRQYRAPGAGEDDGPADGPAESGRTGEEARA